MSTENPKPDGSHSTTLLMVMEGKKLSPITIQNAYIDERISFSIESAPRKRMRQIIHAVKFAASGAALPRYL